MIIANAKFKSQPVCRINLECAKLFMLFPWEGESKLQVSSKSSFPKKATFLKKVKEQHQCTIFDHFGKIIFSLQVIPSLL